MARPRITEVEPALDAASEVLAAKGVAATTVDDVADRAGVSRATIYRYLGGKDEIVGAVIGRETRRLLSELDRAVRGATDARGAVVALVVATLERVDRSPVLHRLNNDDRRDTLPFITVDGAPLIAAAVSSLAATVRDGASFRFDDAALEDALEEGTRLVLAHLTTPRVDGERLRARQLGERIATMVLPLLDPEA